MLMRFLQHVFKWMFMLSLILLMVTLFKKDTLPEPNYYDHEVLTDPAQSAIELSPFSLRVSDQQYVVQPQYDYELQGVVVSYHDADSFTDIWHHRKWKDYLNVRDICVIWGDNVRNGVYQVMDFSNDSWTCWAYWPDAESGSRFSMTQLSNNHLLTNDVNIKQTLMSAETGDHVRLRGYLASYANPTNKFHRGTSTSRTDTGNGACETIYLKEFEIVNKANRKARTVYHFAKWLAIISFIGFLVIFFLTPVTKSRLH